MHYTLAPDVKIRIDTLIQSIPFPHIDPVRVHCIRSTDAKTRAIARIWGMSRLFTEVAGIPAQYIIEVNAKKYDRLNEREKIKTLIHELMHIPKTFSGALLPHRGRHHRINDREVERIMKMVETQNGRL